MFNNMTKKVGLFLTAMMVSVGAFAQQATLDVQPVVTEITGIRAGLISVGAAVIGVTVIILLVRLVKRLIG